MKMRVFFSGHPGLQRAAEYGAILPRHSIFRMLGNPFFSGHRGLKNAAFIGLLAVAMVSVFGCGQGRMNPKARQNADSSSESKSSPAAAQAAPIAELKPWVIGSDERDPALPSAEKEKSDQRFFLQGEDILFENAVRVTDGSPKSGQAVAKPFFLVWNEKALGIPIVNAYFLSGYRDLYRKTEENPERHNAYYDKNSGVWFVPLSEVLESKYETADPNETHWITLELHLSNNEVIFGKVGLRVLGRLPRPQLQAMAPGSPPQSPSDFGRALHQNSWTLKRESYANPSARSLLLWLRVEEASLQWTSYLEKKTFVDEGRPSNEVDPSIAERNQRYHTSLPLRLRRLIVQRFPRGGEGAHSPSVAEVEFSGSLLSSQWVKIALDPFESVRLEWQAHPAQNVGAASIPPARELKFEWSVFISRSGRGKNAFEFAGETVTRSTTRTETWSLQGVRLSGSWARTVFVTDPFVSAADLSRLPVERGMVLFSADSESRDVGVGSILSDTEDFGSQSFFY